MHSVIDQSSVVNILRWVAEEMAIDDWIFEYHDIEDGSATFIVINDDSRGKRVLPGPT